jgi:hypothetical protein
MSVIVAAHRRPLAAGVDVRVSSRLLAAANGGGCPFPEQWVAQSNDLEWAAASITRETRM